jgi:hypothetical protein
MLLREAGAPVAVQRSISEFRDNVRWEPPLSHFYELLFNGLSVYSTSQRSKREFLTRSSFTWGRKPDNLLSVRAGHSTSCMFALLPIMSTYPVTSGKCSKLTFCVNFTKLCQLQALLYVSAADYGKSKNMLKEVAVSYLRL